MVPSNQRRSVHRTIAALLFPVIAVLPSIAHAGIPHYDLSDSNALVINGQTVDTNVQNVSKSNQGDKVVVSKMDGSIDLCTLDPGVKAGVQCNPVVDGKNNPGAQNIQNLQFSAAGGSAFWTSSKANYGAWNDSNTTIYRVSFPSQSNPSPAVQAVTNGTSFTVIPIPPKGQGGQKYAGDLLITYSNGGAALYEPNKKQVLSRGPVASVNAVVDLGLTRPAGAPNQVASL